MSLTVNPRVDDTGHVVRAIKESIMMGGEVVVKDIKENLRGIVSPLTTEITEINILGTIKGADLLGQIMKIIRLMNQREYPRYYLHHSHHGYPNQEYFYESRPILHGDRSRGPYSRPHYDQWYGSRYNVNVSNRSDVLGN